VAEWVAEQLNRSGSLPKVRTTVAAAVAPLPAKLTGTRRWERRRPPAEDAAARTKGRVAPGEFDRLYEPICPHLKQKTWAGDQLMSLEDREAIAGLNAGGMSASRIAEHLGVSRESVLRRLRAVST
jgi:hypothetical protein